MKKRVIITIFLQQRPLGESVVVVNIVVVSYVCLIYP